MTQLTPIGLVKVLGQVTAIVAIPMVGGAVAGLVIDAMLGTSPLLVLSGFVVGNLIAIGGIWLYIRAHTRGGGAASAGEQGRTGPRDDA